jgi:predicted nucleic acid-binding protein
MKTVLFDSGPIISLTTSNLLWILEELKRKSNSALAITMGVKRELVDRPLETLRFKFEALQVESLIEKNTLSVIKDEAVTKKAHELLNLANSILSAHGQNIKIVQIGEMETLAAALLYKADAIVIDERITRTILENPKGLQLLMEKRLHMQLKVNEKALHEFEEMTRHVSVIRSIELVTIAYELGLLDRFVVGIPNARRELLESILWSVKLNGCSVTDDEINVLVKSERV